MNKNIFIYLISIFLILGCGMKTPKINMPQSSAGLSHLANNASEDVPLELQSDAPKNIGSAEKHELAEGKEEEPVKEIIETDKEIIKEVAPEAPLKENQPAPVHKEIELEANSKVEAASDQLIPLGLTTLNMTSETLTYTSLVNLSKNYILSGSNYGLTVPSGGVNIKVKRTNMRITTDQIREATPSGYTYKNTSRCLENEVAVGIKYVNAGPIYERLVCSKLITGFKLVEESIISKNYYSNQYEYAGNELECPGNSVVIERSVLFNQYTGVFTLSLSCATPVIASSLPPPPIKVERPNTPKGQNLVLYSNHVDETKNYIMSGTDLGATRYMRGNADPDFIKVKSTNYRITAAPVRSSKITGNLNKSSSLCGQNEVAVGFAVASTLTVDKPIEWLVCAPLIPEVTLINPIKVTLSYPWDKPYGKYLECPDESVLIGRDIEVAAPPNNYNYNYKLSLTCATPIPKGK